MNFNQLKRILNLIVNNQTTLHLFLYDLGTVILEFVCELVYSDFWREDFERSIYILMYI